MFFNSHFNSNNLNSILELNYMNFFYINEILSHHEYTECRVAVPRSNQSEYWSEDANYKNRTLTLALLRNWVSSASFQVTTRVICPTAGDYFMPRIIEKWIENF